MRRISLVLIILVFAAVSGACGAYNAGDGSVSNMNEDGGPAPAATKSPLDSIEPEDVMRIDRYGDSQPPDTVTRSYILSGDIKEKLDELKSVLKLPPSEPGMWQAYKVYLFDGRYITISFGPQAVVLFADESMRMPVEDAPTLWMKIKDDDISKQTKELCFNVYNETGHPATGASAPRLDYATVHGWVAVKARQEAALLWDNLNDNHAIVKLETDRAFPDLAAGTYRLTVDVDIEGETKSIADIFELK